MGPKTTENFSKAQIVLINATCCGSRRMLTTEDEAKDIDTYLRFVRRTLPNPVARRVKIADIRDNLDLTRLDEITEGDVARLRKYGVALRILQAG